jgi:hypothetical protein
VPKIRRSSIELEPVAVRGPSALAVEVEVIVVAVTSRSVIGTSNGVLRSKDRLSTVELAVVVGGLGQAELAEAFTKPVDTPTVASVRGTIPPVLRFTEALADVSVSSKL